MCLSIRGETDRGELTRRLTRNNSLADKKVGVFERASSFLGGIDSSEESATGSMSTTRRNSVVGGFFSRLSMGSSVGSSLRSTTSMTTNTDADQQQEEDSLDLDNLELLKLATFKRWMLDTVNDMRARGTSHAATSSSSTDEEDFFAVHPLIQVFADKYSSVSVRNKLLRSSGISMDKDEGEGASRLSQMFSKGAGISVVRTGGAMGLAAKSCSVEIKHIKVSNLAAFNVKQSSQSVFLHVQIQGDASAASSEVKMTLQWCSKDEV